MPELYEFDLLCVGSGPAGQRAAIQAAKLGRRAAVVERRRIVGGVCVDTGTIPSKTFREAVLSFMHLSSHIDRYAEEHPQSRPTAEQLLRRVQAVIRREAEVVEDQLWRNDIQLLRGHAAFQDPHTVIVASEEGQRTVRAANVLLAVGSEPSPPPGVQVDGTVIMTSDGLLDLKRLPRRMAVVGGGVIGIEYASMFAALEIDVTVVDKRQRLLKILDEEIVDELMHQMRSRDVTFHLGEAVERLDVAPGPPRQSVIHLASGKQIVSDLVLFSAGRIGATGDLNLEAAGLAADSRGLLKVDGQFRTQVPHIFAAGDVIGFPSLASASAE